MRTSDFRTSNWKACSMIGRSRNLMLIAGLWLPTGMRMSRTRSCMERAPSTTRMNDAQRFPLAAKSGDWNKRDVPDLITSKLVALHYYQLSIPAPQPPKSSFNASAAARGKTIFEGKGKCATCHVPPLYTEPGWPMHMAEEIGIDEFQASRSPDKKLHDTAQGAVRAREGRVLSRRPVRGLQRGRCALQPRARAQPVDPGDGGPGRVSEIVLARPAEPRNRPRRAIVAVSIWRSWGSTGAKPRPRHAAAVAVLPKRVNVARV
jgi:hypothetical protein